MSPNPFVAIVVGAGGVMGKYTAEKLASRGIWLLLADIKVKQANLQAADLAQRYNVRADACQLDITKEEEVKTIVKQPLRTREESIMLRIALECKTLCLKEGPLLMINNGRD